MNVLVACEESQRVCIAFRERGHNAFSCDIEPCSGGSKDAHGNYRRFPGRNERDPKTRSKTFPGIAKAMAEQWG